MLDEDFLSRARPLLMRLLRSQAHREAAAAMLFEQGAALAPDEPSRRRVLAQAQEERSHLLAVGDAWHALVGEPGGTLVQWAMAHAAAHPLPTPGSWLELSLAQLLFDRAGYFQLCEYRDSRWPPHRRLVAPILAEEAEHQQDGADAVRALASATTAQVGQNLFCRWLRVALLSFGRPGSPGSAQAVALGLKRRDPGLVMQDFIDDVRPFADAAGWRLPAASDLQLDGIESLKL